MLNATASIGFGGTYTTAEAARLFDSRPADLTGVVVEARRSVASTPLTEGRVWLLADGEMVASTTDVDGRGVYRIALAPEDWRRGDLAVAFAASAGSATPTVTPDTEIEVIGTIFFGPIDPSFTHF